MLAHEENPMACKKTSFLSAVSLRSIGSSKEQGEGGKQTRNENQITPAGRVCLMNGITRNVFR
jgi:hypothetical protein